MKAGKVLLTDCLRKIPEKEKIAYLAHYNAAQWCETAESAIAHEVGLLLFYNIKNISSRLDIDKDVLDEMRRKYYVSAAKNMRLYIELQKILDIFEAEKISIVLLKGAHLAESEYDNIALREMGDVDLLAKQSDLKRIEERILKAKGTPQESMCIDPKHSCHFKYITQGNLSVETHRRLISSLFGCDIDLDGIRERAKKRTGQDGIFVLSNEDLLIYTCAHAAKHTADMRMIMICDIAEILGRYGNILDWEVLSSRAREWGILRSVYALIRLSYQLLEAAVTEEQLAALRPAQFEEEKYSLVLKQILDYGTAGKSPQLSPSSAKLWAFKGAKGKLKLIAKSIFLLRKTMSLMYHIPASSTLIYLYYPVRLKDVLLRHGRGTWRLIFGGKKTHVLAQEVNEVSLLRDGLLSD